MSTKFPRRRFQPVIAILIAAFLVLPAIAQDGRPAPQAPESRQDRNAQPQNATPPTHGAPVRRPVPDEKVKLNFNDMSVDQFIPWIAEMTGKVIMPMNLAILKNRRITLVSDEFIDRDRALDMLFTAFRLNEVGVVERDDVIILNQLGDMPQVGDLPVLDSRTDVMNRLDRGTVVIKIFAVRNASAEFVYDRIVDTFPNYAKVSYDPNSNQIIVLGDIGLCQQVQRLINELDQTFGQARTKTFRLAYADANEIANNIYDLFEDTGSGAQRVQRAQGAARAPAQRPAQPARGAQPGAQNVQQVGPVIELRVTVNVATNSLTVSAEPSVVDRIAKHIAEDWDLPRAAGTTKVYQLKHSDPLKVRDVLREVLGQGSGSQAMGRTGGAQPGGQRTDISQIVSGIYRIEAIPDANSILVMSKTQESLDFLDDIVDKLDIPSSVGLPLVIQLKHANAVNLSEELNVLLAEAGAGITIQRPGTGLTGEAIGGVSSTGGGQAAGAGGGQAAAGGGRGEMQFPWQRGRTREDQSEPSPLIGKVRIVPIVRQNALAILAPIAQQESIRELINYFDKPGRQVMISAVIAEVVLTDEFAFGLRISNSDSILGGTLADNRIGGGAGVNMTKDDLFGSLFSSSVLDSSFSVNVALQALSQYTNVRVLQEPRVFTADNQEAIFFDGQDIPFITNTQVTDQGTVNESFDYKAVGVQLNVRPRITVERDVDMDISLELSSIVPGQTLFGGFIVDRRTTTTQIIVKNGQTIVLSGILKDSESQITRKVPLLGHIPIIGELFTSRENSKTVTELIAFITPIVVDNPSENEENFNVDDRENLRRLSRPLKEQADDTMRIRERIVDPKSAVRPSVPAEPQPSSADREHFIPE